jgi:hypothetical protein
VTAGTGFTVILLWAMGMETGNESKTWKSLKNEINDFNRRFSKYVIKLSLRTPLSSN